MTTCLPLSLSRIFRIACLIIGAIQALAVDPVVSNVKAKQREGSRMVDITYDVADPDSPTLTVYLKVSADGGATWKGPVELVSGNVGQHIAPGTGKRLVWDAGKEMANQYSTNFRYRIGASDQWLGEPGMVFVPAGLFQMGDERVFQTTPVQAVNVSAFAIDKWEVSIELWESVRAWGNAHGYELVAGGSYGPTHPVHTVDWFDVVKWSNARSEKEGRVPAYYENSNMTVVYRTGFKNPSGVKWDAGYRLPTVAEWEKAARGGAVRKLYAWGTDEISPKFANYLKSSKGRTMPIGSYGANGYGLFDMTGNVCEWCWDWTGGSSAAAQTDPRGPSSGSIRHLSGGSWDFDWESCRLSTFIDSYPNDKGSNVGFRSVLCSGQP